VLSGLVQPLPFLVMSSLLHLLCHFFGPCRPLSLQSSLTLLLSLIPRESRSEGYWTSIVPSEKPRTVKLWSSFFIHCRLFHLGPDDVIA
jgi:hypothetical protein